MSNRKSAERNTGNGLTQLQVDGVASLHFGHMSCWIKSNNLQLTSIPGEI